MTAALLTIALLLNDLEIGVLILGLASLFFLSNVWGLPDKVDFKLDRKIIPDETFGDEDILVELRIRNLTRAAIGNLEIHEVLDDRIIPEKGTNITPASIGANDEAQVLFEFPSPPRANYQIGPMIVRARDPFGFYLTEKKLGAESLSVMPKPERIRGVQLRPRHVGPWSGVIPSMGFGIWPECYSFLDYVPGEEPMIINWKAQARSTQLSIDETAA